MAGIPTFFKLPIALTPEDLKAGDVDVAIIGAHTDMGGGYTPGTGTPEPNGLTPRETFPLIRRLCAESNVVGFELVELLPYRVSGYETVLNSERIVRECLVGITLRKKGITDKAYFAPLTVDDERK
jgi:arginase family enzyme